MAEWVEYMTVARRPRWPRSARANGHKAPWKVPYFGVGNEMWGCGGNMRPDTMPPTRPARYATFIKPRAAGTKIMKIASAGDDVDDYTEVGPKAVDPRGVGRDIDGLSLHYYTVPAAGRRARRQRNFDEAD